MYWTLLLPAWILVVVSKVNEDALGLFSLALWVIAMAAVFTAVYERAKAIGSNPWAWLLGFWMPIVWIVLGCRKNAATPAPSPDYVKTGAISFVAGCALMAGMYVYYSNPSLQSASSLHDQMVEGVIKEAPSLPKQINEVTMLTHERVEGLNMIYTYELTGDGEMPDQADATDNTCKLAVLRDLIRAGVILRFEYNKAGKRLGELEINSCPSTMASVTTNQHHSSIDVVIDGSRALAPLKVGSLSIYATVDTGCADMTMIKTNADKLLANGEATKREDYVAILADGSQRTMPAIVIKTLTIGSHTIHNVTASVVPDGTMMLLGYNILNQVSGKFAINTAKSTLDFD